MSTPVLPGLPDKHATMRIGGLYWLTCESPDTADRLCTQLLASLPASARALLVNAAGASRDLVKAIADERGPGHLTLFDLPKMSTKRLIQAVRQDVPRVRGGDNALWLIRVPHSGWDELVAEDLALWCSRAQDWLRSVGSTLLVVGDTPPPALLDILVRHNDNLSGLAQVYIAQGARHLLVHFWSNDSGVNGPHDFLLLDEGSGFRVSSRPEDDNVAPTTNDQRQVLAQTAVLGSEAPPTAQWQLFESADALLERAMDAQAATVIFALGGSDDVNALATRLYQLRSHCGRSVKLIVREMLQGMRQHEEQLLLASGANLIVPQGTPFLRFLTLVRSIQGHRWQRPMAAEPSSLLTRLQPLHVRGSLSPKAFAAAVKKMSDNTVGTEVRHQLLRLQPVPTLNPTLVLQQLQLRRYGDIACVAEGVAYLFLFACSPSLVDAALRNVFRLPWHNVLAGYESVLPSQVLPLPQFQSDAEAPADATLQIAANTQADAEAFRPLRPQPLSLQSLESRQ
ncbi:cellulose biosynthesis protein BcsE [Pseudomonas sp. H9]|uniref:cellulose biosynthesis protein BcsE n=1 Tax=Pseudomonas sp. H9 TaxID=483968 RepID=UPI0021151E6B|nr:cellulose biosynthesis protein BcsE [Pseudomonas sp. H9]